MLLHSSLYQEKLEEKDVSAFHTNKNYIKETSDFFIMPFEIASQGTESISFLFTKVELLHEPGFEILLFLLDMASILLRCSVYHQ